MGASASADIGGIVAGIGEQTLQKNGRGNEWEVLLMLQVGYDPNKLIRIMAIREEASGPDRVPEFQSTHPDPVSRIEQIRTAIDKYST